MERSAGSYPDPTAERGENVPFYAQQQRSMETAEDSLAHLRDITTDQNGLPIGPEQARPQAAHPSHPHPHAHAHAQHVAYGENMMAPQPNYAHMHAPPHHQLAAEANMLPPQSASTQLTAEQRKKPKVTRACDECRRKKIRCQFNNELTGADQTVANDAERCTNCTRTNSTCEFSRQPQKRGPSKGYIKELADRLHSVEQKVGGSSSDPHLGLSSASPDMRSEEYSRNLPQDSSGKRYRTSESHVPEPLSGGSTTNFGGPDSHPRGAWSSERQTDPLYSPQGFSHPHYGDAQEGSPAMKRRREDADYTPDMVYYSGEVDGNLFDNYMRQIYPTYPILARSKADLQMFLNKISGSTREAFLRALKIASSQHILNATALPVDGHAVTTIYNLLLDKNSPELLQRDVENKLVALQTALLVLIHIDSTGPDTSLGSTRGSWLGMAIDLAQDMKLFQLGGAQNAEQLVMDPNGLKAIGQRCWWSLVIIDKWYAAGTASPPRIPESLIRLGLVDHKIIGHSLFNLTRLSLVYDTILAPFCSPFPNDLAYVSDNKIFTNILKTTLDLVAGFIIPSDVRQTPIPHLAYWHAKLILTRFTIMSPTNIHDMLYCAANIRNVIRHVLYRGTNDNSPSGVGSLGPLAHHAYLLCALTLSEIVDANERREEAVAIARDLFITLEPHRAGDAEALKDCGLCWGNAVFAMLKAVMDKGSQQEGDGLQQLANTAIGVEEGGKERDWAAVPKRGYLNLA